MEPPGGVPPDRDRQLILRAAQQPQPQQQQLIPLVQQVKPTTLTLDLQQQPQQAIVSSTINICTTSPAAPGSNDNANTSSTSPALAATATSISATQQAATAFSGTTVGHQHAQHTAHTHHHPTTQLPHHQTAPQQQQQQQQQHQNHPNSSSLLGALSGSGFTSSGSTSSSGSHQQTIEKLSRPMCFDLMETLVREMQDPIGGVPVRQQKMFLTSIPYAFMGYDLIEWVMDRFEIEESEALNISNQLCLHGYFFPVNDTKTIAVKDDSSLYRFQTPYYWPWQHKAPDNVEYAIYLAKRSLRNRQRHALEDYETEALTSLHKNLKGKWDIISMQAEEQVRLAKERKKGDKIVGDSQERAYWRVHRPPPGQFTPLEPCPIPSRDRQGSKLKKNKTVDALQLEVDLLKKSNSRTRMKMSQLIELFISYCDTFAEFDPFLQPVLPSNPWVTEDTSYWQLNNTFVDTATEKRVRRWALSIEELVSDPTGLQEFTSFLEKEYSHENIRFWIAVNRLRRSAQSQVTRKVKEIYEEFLKPGAPCEINIDGKTMETVLTGLKNPSRFTFDSASEHIYTLLLKKDCYPRFIRSDHYKRLVETGIQPSHKKRFFNFGGVSGAKKKMTAALSGQPNLGDAAAIGVGGGSSRGGAGSASAAMMHAPPPGSLARRRGSDRSLTGSAHELAVIGVNKDMTSKVPHSHSQSNLSEIPYSSESIYRGDMPQRHMVVMDVGIYAAYGNRESSLQTHQETQKPKTARLETTDETVCSAICPWDMPDETPTIQPVPAPAPAPIPAQAPAPAPAQVKLSICPWEQEEVEISAPVIKTGSQRHTSTSSDISDVADRMQRNLGIRHQNTVDSGEAGIKRLIPNFTEQRRASVSFSPGRIPEYQFGRPSTSAKTSTTPSPTVGSQSVVATSFPPLFTPLLAQTAAATVAAAASAGNYSGSSNNKNGGVICFGRGGRGAIITKDPPSTSDAEIEDELNRFSISDRNKESSASELSALPPPTPTPPPITKVTPPPEDSITVEVTSASDDNPRGSSSQAELFYGGGAQIATAGSGAGSSGAESSDTEVEAFVQEVQIELIETERIEPESDTVIVAQRRTPTIQVQDVALVENMVKSAALKSARKFASEVFVEIIEVVAGIETPESQTAPSTRGHSAPQSPEKEHDQALATFPTSNSATIHTISTSPSTAVVPPPIPPPISPMEEEEKLLQEEENLTTTQEELSPTTDEYQEGLQFGSDSKEDYEYDIVDTDRQVGYIAPAPTPAPSMAPLAELDVDTVDDDICEEVEVAFKPTPSRHTVSVTPVVDSSSHIPTTEEVKKRRKKRNSDGKKISSIEDKASTSAAGAAEGAGGGAKSDADRNTVCPWEDENVSASDGTFVKTYATLGYL